jgi:DNA (cytosine-5)-methyltransferase 1
MLRIGTDCSGIEAPIEALKQLGIPFEHKWACEIDRFARKSILANYQPEIIYEDITKRNHSELPDIDIYVCGFPCQSFSLMGKKLGSNDPRCNIMMHCIDVIKKKTPNVFILENVKNFKFIEKGKPFNFLIDELACIVNEEDEQLYNIYCDIYNTKDYGIPQNRERIYIIGIKSDILVNEYIKPECIEMNPLDDIIIDKTIYRQPIIKNKSLLKNLKKINYEIGYVVLTINYYYPLKNICPTLTTQCSKTYLTSYNRRLTTSECLLLQGFSKDFRQVVSNTQMYKQIGNSMSVNVLKVIFDKIFNCTILNYTI